ncbi:Na+/H+ antiporter subunit D [Fulvimarina sp. 2208YS6-2-32]|uniref:Na+/H+ antiporter subunit D n=1 Tax=Fulvimarina uroteuthidis TaxID=3098149 RepID=A0ABU5HZ59_9HYPH|nr:Na+/H+ antiporter subunit D [Fulvimarina sp. 2208YS6-2-32]MDY8108367.1 Na+/H+ antiporter subunit D [Fulvimarina sp. 2208YS6-2-32]
MAADTSLEALKEQAMTQVPITALDYSVVLPVVICFVFGAGLLMIRKSVAWHPLVALSGLALLFLADLAVLYRVATGGTVTMMMGGWIPPFGIAFTADLMGALFLVASGFVALCCGIYSVASVSRVERRYGFFPLLFIMMAGVSGAFVTGDVFNLYVWFEVFLIASFGLLILGSEREQLDGATKYCFLNLVGTTFFLIGTGYLYGIFGTLNMADIARKAAAMEDTAALFTLASIYLVSFAMKAAAFPLNAWLPASYHTPRFVVSALFAGLLTKVGVYAAIRINLMIFPPERADLSLVFAWIAGLTMLVGGLGALAQTDLRRLLNYVVIAGIGTIFVALAMPVPLPGGEIAGSALSVGLSGAIFYALHSIIVMTGLYLAAGVAAHLAGTSSLHEMGGLWRNHPLFAAMMLILLFAVSGLPPFSGFWPKVALVRASIAADMPWLAATVLFSGFLLTIASARVFALGFWRSLPAASAPAFGRTDRQEIIYERFTAAGPDKAWSAVPLLALILVVIAAGVWPQWLLDLTDLAAQGVIDPGSYISSVFGGLE